MDTLVLFWTFGIVLTLGNNWLLGVTTYQHVGLHALWVLSPVLLAVTIVVTAYRAAATADPVTAGSAVCIGVGFLLLHYEHVISETFSTSGPVYYYAQRYVLPWLPFCGTLILTTAGYSCVHVGVVTACCVFTVLVVTCEITSLTTIAGATSGLCFTAAVISLDDALWNCQYYRLIGTLLFSIVLFLPTHYRQDKSYISLINIALSIGLWLVAADLQVTEPVWLYHSGTKTFEILKNLDRNVMLSMQ